jgi:hypothetical protein
METVTCTNCGDVLDPQRAGLGYDYCLKDECQERCIQRVRLAAIGVNKAADYYARAEELLSPPLVTSGRSSDAPDEVEPAPAPSHHPEPEGPRKLKSTLERLRELEAALDAALEATYQRFCQGEMTAVEMNRRRDEMIARFNRVVTGQNIRYRGMLRDRHGSPR